MKGTSFSGGFSLVELMILISLLGILAGISYPLISGVRQRYGLRAEVNELAIWFKKAKVEAVKHNRDVVILFTDGPALGLGGSYQIFVNMDRDGNTPHTFDAGDIQLANVQVTDSRIISNFTNEQAGYNNKGLPIQAANQSVTVNNVNTGSSFTLSVSLAGDVRVR